MSSSYNDNEIGETNRMDMHSGKNSDLAQASQTAVERRRAALEELDEAKFSAAAAMLDNTVDVHRRISQAPADDQWFHARTCLVAGVGFFTDAYDIFSISIAATMIGYVYHNGKANTANQDLGVKVAHSVGTFVGQLLFGWLGDVVGRKRMYGIELIFIIVGTIGTAIAGGSLGVSVYGVIIFWRFIMGVGIGGDYPVSSVITSEFAARRIRGRMMAAVFSAQGWGNLASGIVAIIAVSAFKTQIVGEALNHLTGVDQAWRTILGIGCVPAFIALYFRLTIPETPRYSLDVEKDIQRGVNDANTVVTNDKHAVLEDNTSDVVLHAKQNSEARDVLPKASLADFRRHFGQWKNFKVLFGAAWSWFALDVAFYGLGLNSAIILQTIGFGPGTASDNPAATLQQSLHNVAVGNIILSLGGLLPGYYFTFAFIDSWGRKPIQLMGFSILTVIFICMGFGYDAMQATPAGRKAFVFLYCMANFFQNFGPNTTTFIIPGEVFPTRYRSTAHGICAASGKLGAIIAQVGFSRLINIGGKGKFLPHILEIFALFMLTGVFSTLLLPETKNRSLEDLSQEDGDDYEREVEGAAMQSSKTQ